MCRHRSSFALNSPCLSAIFCEERTKQIKFDALAADEMTWASEGLRVSILCLLWLTVEGPELLVTGGGDPHLRLWRKEERGEEKEMVLLGQFGEHLGPVLALAQSGVYLASASGP